MNTKLKWTVIALAMLLPGSIWAASLFENAETAVADPAVVKESQGLSLNISGYLKGALFAGRNDWNDAILQGSYGEFDLKGTVEKSGLGRAMVDIRYDAGENRGPEAASIPDIREAWAEAGAGPLSVRLGRQIVVWGRADSINPTNNITPMNELALSSEFDDTRIGNELVQLNGKISHEINLTGIWIPVYRPDILPLSEVSLPAAVSISGPSYPDNKLTSGSWAARVEVTTGPIDGSLSYYKGYKTLPGFDYALTSTGISLVPTAYRMQAVGADFSVALFDLGLRGEACYKIPDLWYRDFPFVPAPHFQYVAGVDKTFGDWNALVQYSGVYVRDFQPLTEPVLSNPYDPLAVMQYAAQSAAYEMAKLNRQFTGTADQASHAVTVQAGWSGLSDTLRVKLAGMYNFTTREFAVNPSVECDITDALTMTVGSRDVDGPDKSLNHLVNRLMTSTYAELKCSF